MKKGKDGQQILLSGTAEEEMLARLSERVDRAVESIQQLRKERDELKSRLSGAEEKLRNVEGHSGQLHVMKSENEKHRVEREEIRSRIERVLGTLENIEESAVSEVE
ncbi:MAG: cell division protein ZapB [Acidobacteriota bacterium]